MPEDATYYVGLFKLADGTDEFVPNHLEAIELQMITEGEVIFEDLAPGKYYVFETDAGGNILESGITKDGVNWAEITDDSKQTFEVSENGDTSQSEIELYNMYFDLPEGFYIAGYIDITKNVIEEGEIITADGETFYAGIFQIKLHRICSSLWNLHKMERLVWRFLLVEKMVMKQLHTMYMKQIPMERKLGMVLLMK